MTAAAASSTSSSGTLMEASTSCSSKSSASLARAPAVYLTWKRAAGLLLSSRKSDSWAESQPTTLPSEYAGPPSTKRMISRPMSGWPLVFHSSSPPWGATGGATGGATAAAGIGGWTKGAATAGGMANAAAAATGGCCCTGGAALAWIGGGWP